jgi:glyoxylase-like metal-dependent hydrolase (beta-lactamase superfamily II)
VRPEQVRWVIVTHAHLDHAGGAAALLRAFPGATLVAHPRAARHLIDPERLVASARRVYGDDLFEAIYGSVDPVPAARVRMVEDGEALPLGDATLRFLHTPGHARHHLVVHDPAADTVFTGDTFGLAYPQLQRAGRFAIASTSPTDFDAAEALASIDRILALGTSTASLTHFGTIDRLEEAAAQLRWWIDRSAALVDEAAAMEPEAAETHLHAALERAMAEAIERRGLAVDDDDRSLLEMDLALNAQGLAVAAARRREA